MICFSKNLLLLKRWLSPRQNIDREIKVREGKAKFALWLNGTDGTPPPVPARESLLDSLAYEEEVLGNSRQ